MQSSRKKFTIAAVLVVVVLLSLTLAAPFVQRSLFYPKPRHLPPVVSQSTEELLARLQSLLERQAPLVARELQPGLSADQISALEVKGQFHLSDDLRALYRWRNGVRTNSTSELIPGHRFLSLDEIVLERTLLQGQLRTATKVQRAAHSVFTSHRKDWLPILADGAGDGYFFDPKRLENQGAFFYHFTEVSWYVWFPSFRNFLAGAIEGYESRAIRLGTNGTQLDQDFDQMQKIWDRLGMNSENGK